MDSSDQVGLPLKEMKQELTKVENAIAKVRIFDQFIKINVCLIISAGDFGFGEREIDTASRSG